jgi:hypothetical protein
MRLMPSLAIFLSVLTLRSGVSLTIALLLRLLTQLPECYRAGLIAVAQLDLADSKIPCRLGHMAEAGRIG